MSDSGSAVGNQRNKSAPFIGGKDKFWENDLPAVTPYGIGIRLLPILAESHEHSMNSGLETAHSLRRGITAREAANRLASFFKEPTVILPREFECVAGL